MTEATRKLLEQHFDTAFAAPAGIAKLHGLIEEFVTRNGADWDNEGCTLADKVGQVVQQLKNKKVMIVFDHRSQTANIVACGSGIT